MGAYEDFVAFVHERAFELRGEAHQVTGDDRLTDQLLVRALARVAGRWPSTKDEVGFDPEQVAYDAIARETGSVMRDADGSSGSAISIDGAEYESGVHRTATPLAIADAAWQLSARLKSRRWRRVVAVVAAICLLYVGYYVAIRVTPTEPVPDAVPDNPTHVSYLMQGVDLMPNSYALPNAPLWTDDHPAITGLPDTIELTTDAPRFETAHLDRISAAIQANAGSVVYVLDSAGKPYQLSTYRPQVYSNDHLVGSLSRRSVAPGGKRIVLAVSDGVDVVGIGEDTRHFKTPSPLGQIVDIAWYVDDSAVLVTQAGGTSLLDLSTGIFTSQPFQGIDAVIPTSWNDPLRTLTPGPLYGGKALLGVAEWTLSGPDAVATQKTVYHVAPGATWLNQWGAHGQAHGSLVAKDCSPKDEVFDMPTGYGQAVDCVAILDPAGKSLKRTLIRDNSHEPGPRDGLLGWLDENTLLLSTEDTVGGRTMVIAWSYQTGLLHLVSTVSQIATVALEPDADRT